MKWTMPLVLIAAAGCAPAGGFGEAFPNLIGQPIDVAVARFGPPSAVQKEAGPTAYVWTVSVRNVPLPPATIATTSYATGRPETVETLVNRPDPQPRTCTIRLLVDDRNLIARAETAGDGAACRSYADRLRTGA